MTNIINNHANKVLINGYSYGRDKDKPAIILGITTKYPDIGIINEPRAFHGVKELEHLRFGRRHMLWSITNKEDNPYPSALERIKRGITPENQRIKNRLEEFMAQKY